VNACIRSTILPTSRSIVTNCTATTSSASVNVAYTTLYVPVLWMSAVSWCQPRAVRVS